MIDATAFWTGLAIGIALGVLGWSVNRWRTRASLKIIGARADGLWWRLDALVSGPGTIVIHGGGLAVRRSDERPYTTIESAFSGQPGSHKEGPPVTFYFNRAAAARHLGREPVLGFLVYKSMFGKRRKWVRLDAPVQT